MSERILPYVEAMRDEYDRLEMHSAFQALTTVRQTEIKQNEIHR